MLGHRSSCSGTRADNVELPLGARRRQSDDKGGLFTSGGGDQMPLPGSNGPAFDPCPRSFYWARPADAKSRPETARDSSGRDKEEPRPAERGHGPDPNRTDPNICHGGRDIVLPVPATDPVQAEGVQDHMAEHVQGDQNTRLLYRGRQVQEGQRGAQPVAEGDGGGRAEGERRRRGGGGCGRGSRRRRHHPLLARQRGGPWQHLPLVQVPEQEPGRQRPGLRLHRVRTCDRTRCVSRSVHFIRWGLLGLAVRSSETAEWSDLVPTVGVGYGRATRARHGNGNGEGDGPCRDVSRYMGPRSEAPISASLLARSLALSLSLSSDIVRGTNGGVACRRFPRCAGWIDSCFPLLLLTPLPP